MFVFSAANDKFNKLMEEVKSNSEKVGPANGGQRYAVFFFRSDQDPHFSKLFGSVSDSTK